MIVETGTRSWAWHTLPIIAEVKNIENHAKSRRRKEHAKKSLFSLDSEFPEMHKVHRDITICAT
jgi:hypothetical protein